MKHPEIFNPVMAKNDNDRQIEWLTFKNVNNWTDMVKGELLRIGKVKNEPEISSELLWIAFARYRTQCLCFLKYQQDAPCILE